MKKLIFSVLVLVMSVGNITAQENNEGFKGTWWALGQLEFISDEATDTDSFTILPVVGTFVSPTVTVGLGAGYTSTKIGDSDALDAFILQPLARKYWSISDNFFIFGQADVPLFFGDGFTGYGFNLRPGIDYFVTKKLTLEATFGQFGYNVIDMDGGDAEGTTSLGFNMMEVKFGIKLLL